MRNLIFLGPPGCGKGTQSVMLADKLGYKRVSTGELLREIAKQKSSFGEKINALLTNGELVSDEMVNALIDDFYSKLDASDNVILDGYPRNVEQAKALDVILQKYNTEVNEVFHFNVAEDVLVKRITGRYTCDNCGAIYNSFFYTTDVEGKCNKCDSEKFSRRSDDSEEVVVNRLRVFRASTAPLLDYYAKKLVLIDAQRPATQVFEQIVSLIK